MFAALTAAEREEPLLEFLVAKKLDYRKRIRIVIALAVVGFGLQIALLSVWPGLPLLLAALALSWVVGFDSRVDRRGYRGGSSWQTVPYERLSEIVSLARRMERWDRSAIDVTSAAGAALFVVMLAFIGFLGFATQMVFERGGAIVWVDGALLVAFQWFSGMRRIDKRPELVAKVEHLLRTAEQSRALDDEEIEVQAQLLLRGSEEHELPFDAKLAIGFPDAPQHFVGVQCQVVLNRVQGTAYPYCYSVIIAREGHGLLEFARRMGHPSRSVVETQNKNGVDVVVLRQRTTKTSGYHTKPGESAVLLRAATRGAREFALG